MAGNTNEQVATRPGANGVYFKTLQDLLALADVRINGDRPWDIQIHHPDTARRLLAQGSLGLGESYMDGWWDCAQLDELIVRLLRARLDERVHSLSLFWQRLKARLFNLQTEARAWQVGRVHYDLGNDFFSQMLDPYMAYSCGYWANADTLEAAQEAKLDMICRKLALKPGMRLLDIGCGWGSLMKFAAEHYGVECVGLTISSAQAEFGQERCKGLPVTFHLEDYRRFNRDGRERFDRVASVGMFEHVGSKNYQIYFATVRRSLRDDGLFLLHTIGRNARGAGFDPWIERYIFPNGVLPSIGEIVEACQYDFVVEDWHNFGADYDRTLMAWHARFERIWPRFRDRYGDRFERMWRYYLLASAASFRARRNQLWQIVLSPHGVEGGYRRPC